MIRRDFFKTPLALAGLRLAPPKPQAEGGREELAQAPGLTRSVAEFIVNTTYEDIPDDVIALGSKTLLDGFGLALAGSASVLAPIVRQYISTLGVTTKTATVVGTALKAPPRFAAFANGMSIHADDYDDTGSALHVAAPILPAAFALAEEKRRTGKDLRSPSTSASKRQARLARRSSIGTTAKGFTRPAPSGRSAAPRHARSCAGSPSNRRPTRSASPHRRQAAFAATSDR